MSSIVIFAGTVMFMFFPVISFMCFAFIQGVVFRARLRSIDDDDLGVRSERVSTVYAKQPVRPTIYNFVTADEFIGGLTNPQAALQRKHRIVNELCTATGMIKRQQQTELRIALCVLRDQLKHGDDLYRQIGDALTRLEQVSFVD